MDRKSIYTTCFFTILCYYSVSCDTYNVKIDTEQHVNLVDSKFLSFTIDPKYLFSSSEKYNTKECICMASSLTPAYVRIAGPSTSHMTFRNTTIAIDEPRRLSRSKLTRDDVDVRHKKPFAVTHRQWEKFVQWAKSTGFDLVFALNSDEKTTSGMWDPNTALKILTVADQANIGEIYWQLGYECTNQSIEEYLNDLETLRVIIETFSPGKTGMWKIVGGDVTHCLQADSKSDFKDYVTLSNDMMDAILLNGNSSSQELERMSERDRLKLLKLLSQSSTPLWLTEQSSMLSELDRASDWMASLGYSAKNGFSVHYRELMEVELYEPTLSFYMALLFKNLVGEKVLNVDIEASQAIVFAHCTSLRHKPVSSAVTLYGANMDDEPARFSIKLTKKEEGGDIMQFILGHDHNGNIVVNNRAMYYEGDIRPVVKRVRPYKTLLLNLPPKSFGFWVLANTQVEACFEKVSKTSKFLKALDITESDKEDNMIKIKRAAGTDVDDVLSQIQDLSDEYNEDYETAKENEALKDRIDSINKDLRNLQRIFQANANKPNNSVRVKRQTFHEEKERLGRKIKGFLSKTRDNIRDGLSKSDVVQKLSKFSRAQISRLSGKTRRPKHQRSVKVKSKRTIKDTKNIPENYKTDLKSDETLVRRRRNIKTRSKDKYEDESSENEIPDSKETLKLEKILKKLKKISDLPINVEGKDSEEGSSEGIVLRTKMSEDSAIIDISDKSHTGILKSTLQDILSLFSDFNKNINRFWTAITILE